MCFFKTIGVLPSTETTLYYIRSDYVVIYSSGLDVGIKNVLEWGVTIAVWGFSVYHTHTLHRGLPHCTDCTWGWMQSILTTLHSENVALLQKKSVECSLMGCRVRCPAYLICSSEMFISTCKSTIFCNTEDHHRHLRSENLKYQNKFWLTKNSWPLWLYFYLSSAVTRYKNMEPRF